MMKKKVLSLLLAAALTMSLAACGEKEADSGSSAQNTSGDAQSGQQTDSQGDSGQETSSGTEAKTQTPGGPLTPYDETVTLKVALMIDSNLNYQEGDDISSNPWTRGYKENLHFGRLHVYHSRIRGFNDAGV